MMTILDSSADPQHSYSRHSAKRNMFPDRTEKLIPRTLKADPVRPRGPKGSMPSPASRCLRKRLAAFFAGSRKADRLSFSDVFRHAARRGMVDGEAAERWLASRDSRNEAAHDRGEALAERTPKLPPTVVADARALADMIDAAADG